MRWLAVATVLGLLATGCTSASHKTPQHVHVTAIPASALLDAPGSIRVDGLNPGQRATLTASAVDNFRVTWFSRTTFVASPAGVVDTNQRPVAGSYDDVDPMGFIDRMRPTSKGAGDAVFIAPAKGYRVTITVTVGGHPVAHTVMYRSDAFHERERSYRPPHDGVYADLFLPRHPVGRRPAVLTFSGSGGGLGQTFEAQLLAAHGYPAMALAYFNVSGRPKHLDRIRLEYFVKALRILRRVRGVDPHRILTWGVSRGSEAALLLAAHFPRLAYGTIAGVPSSVVNPSFPVGGHSAWTLHGRPLPWARGLHFDDPSPPNKDSVIPVERIRGPILLMCGGSDLIWPSCPYSNAIVRRLTAHGRRSHVTELRYPTAGHAVGEVLPYVATASVDAADNPFGGTISGDVLGRIDAWRHILKLLAGLR